MASTIPTLLGEIAAEFPETPAQYVKNDDGTFVPRTYSELRDEVLSFAAALRNIGVARGDRVGLISENRAEWFVSDLAILSLGAADVPRGNDSVADEIAYILSFAGCTRVIVENRVQLEKVTGRIDQLPGVETIIVLDPAFDPTGLDGDTRTRLGKIELLTYGAVLETGRALIDKNGPGEIEAEIAATEENEVATVIFTSGTTGVPKGVMLTHRNFIHQVRVVPSVMDVKQGQIWLAVLPVWHSFERLAQYVALGAASAIAYSKPVGKIMLDDFAAVRPQWMASVPRIWESIRAGVAAKARADGAAKHAIFRFFVAVGGAHKWAADMVRGRTPAFRRRSRVLDAMAGIVPLLLLTPFKALGNALVFSKIKARLGGRFVAGVSGGGALPAAVDSFFGAAGILLLEGYGLTETGPGVCFRSQFHPVQGTVGKPIDGTAIETRDEQGNVLPPGEQGVVFIKGPQVMKGYFNQPDETAAMIDDDGWLNSGDLGMITHDGELRITGREKDTIVLLGGENIEPLPIEQKLRESELIEHAVVVGQDQKYLSALIVVNEERLRTALGAVRDQLDDLVNSEAAQALIRGAVQTLVNARNGFRGFEQIFRFAVLPAAFEVGRELSAKQEVKRHTINELYKDVIKRLYS